MIWDETKPKNCAVDVYKVKDHKEVEDKSAPFQP